MVGVAGRSKACNTCRNRKIACGLQRPQCAQCIKSNRLCTGYQRTHVFIINHNLPNDNGSGVGKSGALDNQRAQTGSSDSQPEKATPIANELPKARQRRAPRKISPPTSVSGVPAYCQMLFDTFMRSWIPFDELGPSEQHNFLQPLAELPNQPPVLTTAILAVSLSRIGKVSHDEYLGKQSLRHYTVGLRELQKALYDPKQMHSDATLAACLLLSLYELVECPAQNKHAYTIHNEGCARLIQLRGPKAHRKGLAHSLFLAIRPQCIYQALERHEHTFCTDPDWMEIPWSSQPKSPLDRLIDYIAQAPGIFGTTDKFDQMEPVDILSTALSIIDRCWKMDAELQDFYLHLDNGIPGPMYWPELSTLTNPADLIDEEKGKVFPVAFHFFNLRMATILMLYWANLCMMYHGMTLLYYRVMAVVPVDRKQVYAREDLHPLLRKAIPPCAEDCACKIASTTETPFPTPSSNDNADTETPAYTPCITLFPLSALSPLARRNDFLAPARNVFQSVEYCLQPKMLDMGPSSCVTPLAIVVETLRPYEFAGREVEWGRSVMRGLEGRLPYLRWVRR